jgi:DNA modification methylase
LATRELETTLDQFSASSGGLDLPPPGPPASYRLEGTTVWSFPNRGSWATHSGSYRGNWSPYIPRNLILHYTQPGDLVLDQMLGSGTTLVECKLLGRNAVGVDINPDALLVARDRLNFPYASLDSEYRPPRICTFRGDARRLDKLEDSSVDLVATHPPYAFIIPYSEGRIPGDLSSLRRLDDFLVAMGDVARESFRVLKPGKHAGILMGDTRKGRHYVPIAARVMQSFLEAGFLLKEDIIKLQHNTKGTRENWKAERYDFYKIAHEHLFVFRKPEDEADAKEHRLSRKWW